MFFLCLQTSTVTAHVFDLVAIGDVIMSTRLSFSLALASATQKNTNPNANLLFGSSLVVCVCLIDVRVLQS